MKPYEANPNETHSEEMETQYSPPPTRPTGDIRRETETADETKGREIPAELDYLILGKYRLIKQLGKGGMGEIYLAEHTELRKLVAIKIIGEELCHRPQFISLFKREARSAAKLQHTNIARVFDYGQEKGKCFYVMDYVQGSTLAEIVDSSAPLSLKRSLAIFRQILEALDHAHKSGIIHRDIKSSNILIDDSGSVKLLDFGLARSVYGDDSLTAIGESPGGTPSYMSPEQRKGEPTDARADIYSAGVTLFEMLTGTLPRDVNSPRERLLSELGKSLSPFQRVRTSQVANIVMKCLDDASKRYGSAEEVLAAVQKVERGLQQQRWILGSAAGACAAAGLAVVAVLVLSTPKTQATDAVKYLEQNEFSKAAKVFGEASKKKPSDVKSRYGLGLSYIGLGKLEEAESEFNRISQSIGKNTAADEEGLARVAYLKKDQDTAVKLYEEAVSTGKEHTLIHVTMGDIYRLRNQLDKAVEEYEKALARQPMFQFQLAEAYAGLGYVLMKKNDYGKALDAVEKATKENPSDNVSAFLKSEIARKSDVERQKQIDGLVDDLIKAAKETPQVKPTEEVWESRPTALAILDLNETGSPFARAGEHEMLMFNFARAMQDEGRVSVVEREILDELLKELKLGTSDLAASNAALVLGRIYPAGLIAAGTVTGDSGRFAVNVRLAETETTLVNIRVSQSQEQGETIPEFAERLAKRLTEEVKRNYPLRAKIVKVEGKEVTLNIGSKQGLTPATEMELTRRQAEQTGEKTTYREAKVGRLVVKQVNAESSVGEIVEGDRAVAVGDRATEIVKKEAK